MVPEAFGGAPALADLMGGQVDAMMVPLVMAVGGACEDERRRVLGVVKISER